MSWQLGATELPKRLLGAFLLREPERRARAFTSAQHKAIVRYHAAAGRRTQVARNLQGPTEAVAAISLYREAAVLLIAAIVQTTEEAEVTPPRTPEEAWKALDARPEGVSRKAPPEGFARAREVLSTGDPLSADDLSPGELSSAMSAAADAARWLASAIEPRTLREIRANRALRITVAALLLAYALYALIDGVVTPRNLALHKPASASSQRFDATPPSGVTNGDLESNFGVHTNDEPNPWVQVDLGAPLTIHEVSVYNRGDGYQGEMVPLVLQLSDDGRVFTEVARREELFTQDKPWVVKLAKQRTRYVRVQLQRSHGYIALSEIKVY
jgi:hypothetical protein